MKRTAEDRERLIETYQIEIVRSNRGFTFGREASSHDYINDDKIFAFDVRFAGAVDKLLDKLEVMS